jgi:hypothetical protein
MGFIQSVKDTLDWGKRLQFLIQIVAILLSGSVVASVRAMLTMWTHISGVWRLPIYCFTAGVSLLGFALLARWLLPSEDKSRADARNVLEDVMRAGVETALYNFFSCRARDLIRELDSLWHRWNNAGEKLIHPVDANLDVVADWSSTDKAIALVNSRRDFLVLYGHHVMMVKLELPEFTSGTIEGGYPSDRGYVDVRADLVEHVEKLEQLTKNAWKKYGSDLDKA